MKAYYKDPLLVRAIEAHKKIVTEGEFNLNRLSVLLHWPIAANSPIFNVRSQQDSS
jgi:hypothetical protein